MKSKSISTVFKVTTVIFGVLTLACVILQVFVKPKPYTDITKEYTYTGSNAEALPSDWPEKIEEGGETYTRVVEEGKTPEVTVVEKNGTYTKNVSFDNLESKQAPKTYNVTISGKTCTLNLESAYYVKNKKSDAPTNEIKYDDVDSEPTPPETNDITYTNKNGETVTVQGQLVSLDKVVPADESSKKDDTQETTVITTIKLPEGCNVFVVNGHDVTYDANNLLWDGYQEDVIACAKLAKGTTVTKGEWYGEPYKEGSTYCRDVIWTIQPNGASSETGKGSYVATYIAFDEKNPGYSTTAIYSANVNDLGLDESDANGGVYKLSVPVTYRIDKIVSSNPIIQFFFGNEKVMPTLMIVSIIGLFASLIGFVLMERIIKKRQESTMQFDNNDDFQESW